MHALHLQRWKHHDRILSVESAKRRIRVATGIDGNNDRIHPISHCPPSGCPKTYQLLSFCHGERSRAISLNLQERVLRSLDCARDDRMIVSEEFSDNLPHIYFAWGRIAHFHIACHIPEEVNLARQSLSSFARSTLSCFAHPTLSYLTHSATAERLNYG